MGLKLRDLVATILVAAIAVPYVGYLLNGEMPFIEDPRGMSATGLVLGAAAFVALTRADRFDRTGKTEAILGAVAGALGIVALAFAETAAAEALLAVFMASIALTFVVGLMKHMGAWSGGHRPAQP